MKTRLRKATAQTQQGAVGIFLCVALVITFGLISIQNITTTSLDLYLSNSKQHIEEARQLAYSGLRHYTQNFGNDEAIQVLLDTYKNNPDVVGVCSLAVALPDILDPKVQLAIPPVPDASRQNIVIRGVIVPYNCDHSISDDNYRATFEIVASVNCTNNNDVGSGCVKRSFVFNREDNDDGKLTYNPIVTPPPPPPPPPPPRPPKPPEEKEKEKEKEDKPKSPPKDDDDDDDDDDDKKPKPPKPKSKGRQEVGF